MKLGIVIPALNEAATIAAVVAGTRESGIVIVVDDGSSDGTGQIAEAAGATVVRHPANRGYDAALASGFARAQEIGCDAVMTFDADGQHDPAVIGRMLQPLQEGTADLVLGRRSEAARFAEWLFNTYTALRFGVPDILCGLKAYRAALCRPLDPGHHGSIGTFAALEALRHGAKVAVVPVPIHPRHSRPRIGGVLRANVRIVKALAAAISRDLRLARA